MKSLPVLYKRATTGAPQQWQIFINGDSFYTKSGQVGGAITTSASTTCSGKNIGKSNETTPSEQAKLEAQSRWQKKIDSGYVESLSDIDNDKKFFAPMLAKKYLDYRDKVEFPALASRKIDGMRMVCTKGSLKTRNGKDIPACPHILKALDPFFKKYPNGVVDGEIYAADEFFEDVMSLVKQLKPTPEDIANSEQKAKLWIFDGFTSDQQLGFAERFEDLKKAIKQTVSKSDMKYFVFVENKTVKNHEEFLAEHDKYVSEGFEGAMFRVPDSPYENKRSKFLLKHKSFDDSEFRIIDILEGKGSDSGKASKIVVELKNGGTSEAGIRGSDDYARKLFLNKKKYIGKKATCRYQGFTKEGKLRFGVAVTIAPLDR